MQIIPVIDLMQGQVVHAKFGQRSTYAPISSDLCTTSAAHDVVAALVKLYRFHVIYIRPLNEIYTMLF